MIKSTPEQALAHFQAHDWCAAYINYPDYEVVLDSVSSTASAKKLRESTFFSSTLVGDDKIRATLQLNRKPDDALLPAAIREVVTFWDLGSGMNGYIGIAHGGFISALLDHHTGTLIYTNHTYAEHKSGRKGLHTNVTVGLNIRFQGPVKTPTIILMRSRVVKIEARKLFIQGTVEDSQGKVLATGDALFVTPRTPISSESRL